MKITLERLYTMKFKRMLAVLTASFLFLSFSSTAYSAMDPAEIREINENAHYHLIGAVTQDKLIQQLSDTNDSPSQLRAMTLEITEVNRIPTNEPIHTIEIIYTYVPPWISRVGGKGMDIAVGDVIEVWLNEEEAGLVPAVGDDSVNHIFYVEERPVHLPEPLSSKARHAGESILLNPHTSGNAVVISCIAAFSALIAFLGLRKMKHTT